MYIYGIVWVSEFAGMSMTLSGDSKLGKGSVSNNTTVSSTLLSLSSLGNERFSSTDVTLYSLRN